MEIVSRIIGPSRSKQALSNTHSVVFLAKSDAILLKSYCAGSMIALLSWTPTPGGMQGRGPGQELHIQG